MTETRGQQVSRVLASIGFIPRRGEDGRFLEYTKDYADSSGKVARCTILFHRGGLALADEHGKLAGFSVTVQAHIDPHPDEVTMRAPFVMRGDMFSVLEQLAGVAIQTPMPVDAVAVKCDDCGKQTHEFVVAKTGAMVCPKCLTRHIG